jgi:ABC-type phosphate/phosphonate transport system substrate-binding protein
VAGFFANARMYAVTPECEAAWRALLAAISADAEVPLDYLPWPAPQPLEPLWRRPDLGCALMCGYPIALGIAEVAPIAAPVPAPPFAEGRPLYVSDLIVRRDAPYRRLEDTFGGVTGWTVEHSHSGFNAWRHHLLAHRTPERPTLYARSVGHLVTARAILDAVREGRIDIGPLDGWWHALIARHAPHLVEGIRVLERTAPAPIPAFVAAPALPDAARLRLAEAFAAAHARPWFPPLGETLLVERFAPVDRAAFAETLRRHREAVEAGYPVPA